MKLSHKKEGVNRGRFWGKKSEESENPTHPYETPTEKLGVVRGANSTRLALGSKQGSTRHSKTPLRKTPKIPLRDPKNTAGVMEPKEEINMTRESEDETE